MSGGVGYSQLALTAPGTKHRWAQRLATAVVIVVAAVAGLAWWLVWRPLAKLDGRITLPGLNAGVVVDRDGHGTPWIRAASVTDLLEAQGYITASDRLWQMDLLRRAASGELAEILGPAALEQDEERRTLGLSQAAQAAVEGLDGDDRAMVAAYARGVNAYIEQHKWNLPLEFRLLRYQPRPWRETDTFLVAGYMYELLTSSWKQELERAEVTGIVGASRARDMYSADSPYDHPLAGEGRGEAAPVAPDVEGLGAATGSAAPEAEGSATADLATLEAWRRAQAMLNGLPAQMGAAPGSNNFVVSGAHTYSGKPLLANDTHLPLRIPSIWYIDHLSAPGWNVAGFSLPGVPLVIIGHNERIAWGFTNDMADVQDLYIEKLNPANPGQYLANGRWRDASISEETIAVRGRAPARLEVMRTRHGPVVYRHGTIAYALEWTALEPGGIGYGFPLVGRAKNWQQFLEAMQQIPGPPQNAVYADVDGNIGFVVMGRIPIRKKGNGSVAAPGDSDEYAWTGYIPFDRLPQAFNPPDGVIATANGRITGPGYKYWITDRWEAPYRTARLYQLLDGARNLRPADCDAIQNDVVSLPDRFLAAQMLDASRLHQPADPEARELVRRLEGWDGRSVADSVEATFLSYERQALVEDLLKPYLGEHTKLYDWFRSVVFVETVLRTRPARWLPPAYASYDLLLAAAADQAVARLRATRGPRLDDWRWGRVNSLELQHPLALKGPLRWLMDIGPVGHDGSSYTVKAIRGGFGPAMRFVSDMSDFDNSLMELTPGESGQYGSRYYKDEFGAWLSGRGIEAPFTPEAEAKVRAHEFILEAAGKE